jgi:hypothetical protein
MSRPSEAVKAQIARTARSLPPGERAAFHSDAEHFHANPGRVMRMRPCVDGEHINGHPVDPGSMVLTCIDGGHWTRMAIEHPVGLDCFPDDDLMLAAFFAAAREGSVGPLDLLARVMQHAPDAPQDTLISALASMCDLPPGTVESLKSLLRRADERSEQAGKGSARPQGQAADGRGSVNETERGRDEQGG